jgi:hypothetical protein
VSEAPIDSSDNGDNGTRDENDIPVERVNRDRFGSGCNLIEPKRMESMSVHTRIGDLARLGIANSADDDGGVLAGLSDFEQTSN